ncbi:MAG TPA: TonB-dependent receptor, partial [Bryobacteraceae bacterium]|nr:TonB-dependent receptor [Bryobacteraceae bacterium]
MQQFGKPACARALLVLFAVFLCASTNAQEVTGRILGTVTDETGAVIPEAKVVATSPSVPRGLEATTDSRGAFTFVNVPIGTYAITVTKTGFATWKVNDVNVTLGSQVNVTPKLSIGQVSEVVEVLESAVTLDTTSSRTSTNITQAQFDGIAKNRNFNSVLALAPGVRSEIKGGNAGVGGYQVDGASGSENAYIIDGVEVTDVRRGSLRPQNAIPLEFVQEVQVKSGGFEAEYGGATGGVINVATRSGSNEYHGQAYLQWTNDSFNARDRGFWQRSVANAAVAEFFAPKEDDYSVLYPGGAIGGPVLRDRLFFFGSFSPELEHTERNIAYASGARTYKQDIRRYYGMGRLDYNPFQKLQINSSYIWSPQKISGYLPSRDFRLAPQTADFSKQGGYAPAQSVSVSSTYAATSNLVLSARYGYRYLNDKLGNNGLSGNYGLSTQPYIVYQNSSLGLAGVPAELQQGTNYRNVPNTFGIQKDITTRNNLYLDATYILRKHTFKGGYNLARLTNDVLNDYTNGYFPIFWNDSFSRGEFQNVRGAYGYYIWEDGVKNTGSVNSRNQAIYLQDSWRVLPTLTLNLGIRFENEFLPPFQKEFRGRPIANPIAFGWGDKVAPRIGAAWDILGDGRWKLSGSFGIFYDQMKYELARGSFGSDYWISHVYRLDNPAGLPSLGFANPGAAGTKITQYDNRTLSVNERGEIEGVDPAIKPYTSREFSMQLEHQFAPRVVGAIRYVRKDLLRGIEDIGVLDAEGSEVYVIGNPGYGVTRNPNSVYGAKTPNGTFLVPKAKRQYNGVELRLQGHWRAFNWISSYTWSRLYGNYSGAANSDESGRSDPGVSRAYDLPFYYFDASGSQKPVEGLLGTDRPHTFKLFGNYVLNTKLGSTNFGVNQIAYSGTPDTSTIIYQSAPTQPFGRGDVGRTPFLTQTDLNLYHEFRFTERARARFEVNILNLFNQAAVISRVTQMNRSGAISATALPISRFFSGYDPRAFLSANGGGGTVPLNPIYRLPGA